MIKVQFKESYVGASPLEVFEASKAAFEEMGMEIIKVRSFAYFLQARTTTHVGMISASIMVSSFQNSYELIFSSDTENQEILNQLANDFNSSLNHQINKE